MRNSKQSDSADDMPVARWYRRNGWVTAMVAGTLFVGPLLAIPVLLILCTGPVYNGHDMEPWDISTKLLVLVFSFAVTALWILRVAALLGLTN